MLLQYYVVLIQGVRDKGFLEDLGHDVLNTRIEGQLECGERAIGPENANAIRR